jgi:hypothetical protein
VYMTEGPPGGTEYVSFGPAYDSEPRQRWWITVEVRREVFCAPFVDVEYAREDIDSVHVGLREFLEQLSDWASESTFGWGQQFIPPTQLTMTTIDPEL